MRTMALPGANIVGSLILVLAFAGSAAGQMGEVAGTAQVPAAEVDAAPAGATPLPLPAFAALGSSFAQTNKLGELGWSEDQIMAFMEGVKAALHGKAYPMDDSARQVSAEMARRLQQAGERRQQLAVEDFARPGRLAKYMKEMRKRYAMEMSDSGLVYFIQPGQAGVRPRPGDTVVVSYVATASDGKTKLPQLSHDHARVKLENLLPGFMEGFQMMTVDSQARFILPPALSFGAGEWPQGVDRGTPLLFMVTLHEVISAENGPANSP